MKKIFSAVVLLMGLLGTGLGFTFAEMGDSAQMSSHVVVTSDDDILLCENSNKVNCSKSKSDMYITGSDKLGPGQSYSFLLWYYNKNGAPGKVSYYKPSFNAVSDPELAKNIEVKIETAPMGSNWATIYVIPMFGVDETRQIGKIAATVEGSLMRVTIKNNNQSQSIDKRIDYTLNLVSRNGLAQFDF